jgi:branched-chain amino acid transport system permease protein
MVFWGGNSVARNNMRIIAILVVWLAMAVLPLVSSDYMLNIFIMILFYAFLGQAWNIMGGYAGQFSFGHAVFYGAGAYTSTLLFLRLAVSPWIGMLAGMLVAVAIGMLIGFLCFRYKLKGPYLALATLAFAEIAKLLVLNLDFFNKSKGLYISLGSSVSKFEFTSNVPYYYIIFGFLTLLTLFVWWMSTSRLGFRFIAIRENEEAAMALGINTLQYKLVAMVLSAAFTAMAGTFYAQYLLFIEPNVTFSSNVSISILLPVIVGGSGTILGPIVGSFLITPIEEVTTTWFSSLSGLDQMVYGALLVVMMLFMPEGVVGILRKLPMFSRNKLLNPESATTLVVPEPDRN